jgi:dihydroneopterin triphosphate diphosphatase
MKRGVPSAFFMPLVLKIPQSVLVVIHTAELDVLLIKRADAIDFWQSVTGSKDNLTEAYRDTAVREVREETGIDCSAGSELTGALHDWGLENCYDIYPAWQHRYAAGVTRNTERLFGLQMPAKTPVQLNPAEHTEFCWLPWRAAAEKCYSPSNSEACLMLPRFLL